MKSSAGTIIAHPLTVFAVLLFIMIGSTVVATYFDPSRTLKLPEWNFASSSVGRDLQNYSVLPISDLMHGKTPFIFGYGSVIVAYIFTSIFAITGLCQLYDLTSCGHMLYILLITSGFGGLVYLLYKNVTGESARAIAVLFLGAFLLGVPMNKAIEAGNVDLILAVACGVVISALRRPKQTFLQAISVGLLLGILLATKAFFLFFVGITLAYTLSNPTVIITTALTYFAIALWPWLFGVHSGLFDVFSFATRGSEAFTPQLYTQINYGNNAFVAYVSNILQAFDTGRVLPATHHALVILGTITLTLLIFGKPWIDEGIHRKWKTLPSFRTFPFVLLLYVLATCVVLTLTTWSYDYRILYNIPLLFLLFGLAKGPKTKQLVYLSMASLLVKSLWIPKDRIMTIFLYIHIYYLLRAALSLWANQSRQK